jgi:two-component system LytT family response regulator
MTEALIRILIVDDEPLARELIRRMLENDPEVEIAGECRNGSEAVAAIIELKPDLVFLDVQMPKMNGITALETLGVERMPQVIFTTAYEQYAIQAFEFHALDYLLKPFDHARFNRALKHAKAQLRNSSTEIERRQVAALLESIKQKPEYLDRLVIKAGGRILFLKTEEIDWIEAEDKYVHLHAGKSSHMVRQTLSALEAQLDPKKFVRIHRSTIVNVERIKELRPLFSGDHMVVLLDGTELTLSRYYKDRLL